LFLTLGLGLVLAKETLAEATTRSNAAFTRGRAFTGPRWAIWNRIVCDVAGTIFIAFGGGLAVGLIDLG
jgi:hypothetical protein